MLLRVGQAATVLAVLGVAACGSPGTTGARPAERSPGPSPSSVGSARPVHSASPSPKATPAPRPPKVAISRFRARDGSVVTLATFRGPVTYRLHSGSQDPGHAALSVVRAGPSVTGGERHRLLAAFNGGFLLSAGAGGYEQEGHVISPLIRGLASLVIDRSGSAQIGSWGHGVPRAGEPVTSVRQNLRLLVRHGRVSAAAANWGGVGSDPRWR